MIEDRTGHRLSHRIAGRTSLGLPLIAALLLATLAAACGPDDPIARVEAARAQYTVQLNSWLDRTPEPAIDDEMAVDQVAVVGEAAASAEAAEGETELIDEEGAEMIDIEPLPITATVLFDLVVAFAGGDPLPGITVEVVQEGADGEVKARRRHWIETEGIRRGRSEQVSFELEGFDLADGDSFGVSLRPHVPAEERGEYREFSG